MQDCEDRAGKRRMIEHCINWPVTLLSCLARFNSFSSQSLDIENAFKKDKKDNNMACGCFGTEAGSVCEYISF